MFGIAPKANVFAGTNENERMAFLNNRADDEIGSDGTSTTRLDDEVIVGVRHAM